MCTSTEAVLAAVAAVVAPKLDAKSTQGPSDDNRVNSEGAALGEIFGEISDDMRIRSGQMLLGTLQGRRTYFPPFTNRWWCFYDQ